MFPNKLKKNHYEVVSSTNDKAKELLKNFSNVIVTADYQTNGRGRNKNKWFGSKGNVFFSRGIRHNPRKQFSDIMLLQAAGALAVKNILKEYTGKNIFLLKYPNDVLINQNNNYLKISGVVTEHSFLGSECSESIIGIGINLIQEDYPEELTNKATSINNLGITADKYTITELLIVELEKIIKQSKSELFEIWKNTLNIEGKKITLLSDNQQYFVKKLNENGTLSAISINTNNTITIDNGDSIRYEYK